MDILHQWENVFGYLHVQDIKGKRKKRRERSKAMKDFNIDTATNSKRTRSSD